MKNNRWSLALVLLASVQFMTLAFALGCSSQDTPTLNVQPQDNFVTRLDSLIPRLLDEHGVPGLAVGIIEKGRITCAKGYGFSDRNTSWRVTDQTLFNFASVSKPVTAWGVLRLVDAGSISLDVPVNSYLRRWRLPESTFGTDGVTVRRLLSHTAGISVPTVPWFPADAPPPDLVEVLRGEKGTRGPVVVKRKPGERWDYSGGGYAVLQLLIEEVTGKKFDTYMRESIFELIGMKCTTFAPAADRAGIATAYDNKGALVAPYRLVGEAAGGLYSTVGDFARLLTAYAASGNGIIDPALFQTMTTPVARVEIDGADLRGTQYGLGHGIHVTPSGTKVVYHSGGNPGYLAYFLIAPEQGKGIVVVSNGSNAIQTMTEVLQAWSEHYRFDLPPLY